MFKGLGAIFVIIVVIVAVANQGGSDKAGGDKTAASAASNDGTGDNIDGRSRYFVNQIRHCMRAVNLLGQVLQGGVGDIAMAEATRNSRGICDAARERMALADTSHFSDQALDAEVAIGEFQDGLKDVADYIDTLAPSKVANGTAHFQQGRAWMAQALDGINSRRAIYGAAPLG